MVKRLLVVLLILCHCGGSGWGQTAGVSSRVGDGAHSDSLLSVQWKVLPAQQAKPLKIAWNRQTTLGISVTIGATLMAIYCHNQADRAYHQYLRSGSYAEIRRQFKRAERFDKLTGWAYAVAELGFVITVFSFDL